MFLGHLTRCINKLTLFCSNSEFVITIRFGGCKNFTSKNKKNSSKIFFTRIFFFLRVKFLTDIQNRRFFHQSIVDIPSHPIPSHSFILFMSLKDSEPFFLVLYAVRMLQEFSVKPIFYTLNQFPLTNGKTLCNYL